MVSVKELLVSYEAPWICEEALIIHEGALGTLA